MSKWIDADAIDIRAREGYSVDGVLYLPYRDIKKTLDSAPSIEIVRCQDCKYWVHNFNGCARNPCTEPWYATDFCNYGERNNG